MKRSSSGPSPTTTRSVLWSSAPGRSGRTARRLDRHVLPGERQVGQVRRGLRLLRPVALRRGRRADARDDGARSDPRAREGGRGRPRPPFLHGHPRAGTLEARLRQGAGGRRPGRRAHQPEALCLDRPHVGGPGQAAEAGRYPAGTPPRARRLAPTTRRSPPPFATRAGCARSTRSRRRASRPASAESSTWASPRASASKWPSSWRRSTRTRVPINLLNPHVGAKFGDRELMEHPGRWSSGWRSSA